MVRRPALRSTLEEEDGTDIPDYDDRVLAYVDILGWRDRIMQSQTNKLVLRPAIQALAFMRKWRNVSRTVRARAQQLSQGHSPFVHQVTQFSDLIAVSCKPSRDAVLHLLYVLQQFANRILISGRSYTRGAVVRGHLIHTDAVIIGPALVDAYEREQSRPGPPRIQVAPSVLQLVGAPEYPYESDGRAVPILEDGDGVFFLDALQEAGDTTLLYADMLLKAAKEQMKEDYATLDGATRDSVIAKHQWMIAYLTSVTNRFSQGLPSRRYWERTTQPARSRPRNAAG